VILPPPFAEEAELRAIDNPEGVESAHATWIPSRALWVAADADDAERLRDILGPDARIATPETLR